MADVLHDMGQSTTGGRNLCFHCPGCGYAHPVDTGRWHWNGSWDKPTFAPSLLCNQHHEPSRCHSWIVEGKIRFEADCWHKLRGSEAALPAWDETPGEGA